MLLFGLILIGYVVLYLGGRNYLRESFQSGAGANSPTAGQLYPTPMPVAAAPPAGSGRVLMEYTTLDPVAKGSIQKLDDYEYNYVYQNESDRALSQELKNKLMSQRPMEWAGLPPSSSQFQAGLRESFQNANPTVPNNPEPFRSISGDTIQPPDTESIEMEERKILQTYKAPSAKELTSYNVDEDPQTLIKKVYDAKGLIPIVDHKEGTNVYEIIGVRRKDEKILYEDEEAPASLSPVQQAGEANIQVPPTAYDTAAAKDPYYDMNGSKSRIGKWDYQAWTPGLDRMFAPTNDTQAWN
ncbi:MAG: hypothetical protein EBU66_10885 [Bacteroidetes bacterium]|nr:hypothetical protein [Bacteroidota bacterium]